MFFPAFADESSAWNKDDINGRQIARFTEDTESCSDLWKALAEIWNLQSLIIIY